MGCDRPCCRNLFLRPATNRKVVSLGISDSKSGQLAMFEATPDVASQWNALQSLSGQADVLPSIFLTHAHIGHYSGLMFLGREVLGATGIKVHAMPRFRRFLQTNGPWDQLISLGNIVVNPLAEDSIVKLRSGFKPCPSGFRTATNTRKRSVIGSWVPIAPFCSFRISINGSYGSVI